MLIKSKEDILKMSSFSSVLSELGVLSSGDDTNRRIKCPFHNGNECSFAIYGSRGVCFVCGWIGDIVDVAEDLEWFQENADVLFKEKVTFDMDALKKNVANVAIAKKFWAGFVHFSKELLLNSEEGRKVSSFMEDQGCDISIPVEYTPYGIFNADLFAKKFTRTKINQRLLFRLNVLETGVYVMFFDYTLPSTLTSIKFRKVGVGSELRDHTLRISKKPGYYCINYIHPKNASKNTILVVEDEIDVSVVFTNQIAEYGPSDASKIVPVTCCTKKELGGLIDLGYDQPILFLNKNLNNLRLKEIIKDNMVIGQERLVMHPENYNGSITPAEYVKGYMSTGRSMFGMWKSLFSESSEMTASTFLARKVLKDFGKKGILRDKEKYNLMQMASEVMDEYFMSGVPGHNYVHTLLKELNTWESFENLTFGELKKTLSNTMKQGTKIKCLNGEVEIHPNGYYYLKNDVLVQLTDFLLEPKEMVFVGGVMKYSFNAYSLDNQKHYKVVLTGMELVNRINFRSAISSQIIGAQVVWVNSIMPNLMAVLAKQCVARDRVKQKKVGYHQVKFFE